MSGKALKKLIVSDELEVLLNNSKGIVVPESRKHLLELAFCGTANDVIEVGYHIPGKGTVVEATVTRCKNGVVVNYTDIYMRRRDPDCMVIGDDGETDKERYADRFGEDFNKLREESLKWLGEQELILMPFMVGDYKLGYPALLIAPKNAGFFAAGLADLQGFIPGSEVPDDFAPRAVIYLTPHFRHTHFNGKQVVVHNRREDIHEVFSYNLYPGPSAKKGVYGILLNIAENEGWTTLHASTVRVTTPYENTITFMHEGASGGGKSEMIEEIHRESDGRVMLGENSVSGERVYLELTDTCELSPVTDDMALCHPAIQRGGGKLVVKDAESGWFLRVNHINEYGTAPHYERLCIHPKEPLIFLNMDAAPGSTCLIWEHIMDKPGQPCPNPRVIMPRRLMPGVVDEAVEVDIRSFGVRAPICTRENPTYGIVGMLQILPPALAWLWRLVAPRGHANPSITDTGGMVSEGVGSYWPFATGKMVQQANLLLKQFVNNSGTRYVLIPNQNLGAYSVGFMPQWLVREYLARRGSAKFKLEQLVPSRCSVLGYSLDKMKINGTSIPKGLLQPHLQPEVGSTGFEAGGKILTDFFKRELEKYLTPELDPLGREIIECCLRDGTIDDYVNLIPMR